ncbi:hypothetical protein IE53DRAFT_369926 [Violaceomyces palustris]|uniref:Uncharacterized protein n=1 Tax=Violaceomyces palustris TaxID=1673888 RepID=A0ACD0NTX0_9BASI|nr:hypothetical protein IE53DRAFT_369926 [Violaceomyces palustris]
MLSAQSVHRSKTLDQLPPELITEILLHLLPCIASPPSPSTSPPVPSSKLSSLQNSTSSLTDLAHASLVSSWLRRLVIPILWRSPILTSLSSVAKFAHSLASQPFQPKTSPPFGCLVQSLHLPSYDGILERSDTSGDQHIYADSLRRIFDLTPNISSLSIGHFTPGGSLHQFLNDSTICRPQNVTLANLGYSTPPFSSLHLTPLERVQRLHLIKILPPPTLINFICGNCSINPNQKGRIEGPSENLTHIRLSLLPADSLLNFSGFLEWRNESDAYESLPYAMRLRSPAPRPPSGPLRRLAAQEALYSLAKGSPRLKNLKLLMLELEPLEHSPTNHIPRFDGATSLDGAVPIGERGREVEGDAKRRAYWKSIKQGKEALMMVFAEMRGRRSSSPNLQVETLKRELGAAEGHVEGNALAEREAGAERVFLVDELPRKLMERRESGQTWMLSRLSEMRRGDNPWESFRSSGLTDKLNGGWLPKAKQNQRPATVTDHWTRGWERSKDTPSSFRLGIG